MRLGRKLSGDLACIRLMRDAHLEIVLKRPGVLGGSCALRGAEILTELQEPRLGFAPLRGSVQTNYVLNCRSHDLNLQQFGEVYKRTNKDLEVVAVV